MKRDPDKWFHPKKHSGWKKEQSPAVRRAHLFKTTNKNKDMHARYLEAARRVMALSNVTEDRETSMKARADSLYFYAMARNTRRKTK